MILKILKYLCEPPKKSDLSRIKKNFIKPSVSYVFGNDRNFGTPYFKPWNYCGSVILVRKIKVGSKNTYAGRSYKLRTFARGSYTYHLYIGWPIVLSKVNLKVDGSNYRALSIDWVPSVTIFFFGYAISKIYSAPKSVETSKINPDTYWVMYIYSEYYSTTKFRDIKDDAFWRARESRNKGWEPLYVKKGRYR